MEVDLVANTGRKARSYRLGPGRRAANLLVTGMLRLGVGFASSYLLTTTGRKTLTQRTTPVTIVKSSGRRWLVSLYGTVGWVHNIRALPGLTLRRGRRIETLCAREVNAEAVGPVLRDYVRCVSVTAAYFGSKVDDPVASFAEEAARHPEFHLAEKPEV